jgi:transcriptional regulator with XRE-family HTH domain
MSKTLPYKLIQKSFKKRQQEDSELSLRGLAEQIKISPGYLSKILAGKKPLNKKIIENLGYYLKMDELQYQQLLESYEQKIIKDKFGHIKKSKTIKENFAADEYELLPLQSEWILSKWYYL